MSSRKDALPKRPLPPRPPAKQPRAGFGPNKASGHKGGMGRQGSKRG